MMSKKHFKALAEALRITMRAVDLERDPKKAVRELAEEVARIAAQTNPRFDRSRFLAACGMEG